MSVSSCDGGALLSHLIGPHPVSMATCSDKTPHDLIPIRASRSQSFGCLIKSFVTLGAPRAAPPRAKIWGVFFKFKGFSQKFWQKNRVGTPLLRKIINLPLFSILTAVVINHVNTDKRNTGNGHLAHDDRPRKNRKWPDSKCRPTLIEIVIWFLL